MSHLISKRKKEHIDIITNHCDVNRRANHFDQIQLTHRAFPEMRLSDVDPSVKFLNKKLSFPLLISSMTGGGDTHLEQINKNLAIAAEATNVAMSVGSQRVLIEDSSSKKSFALRRYAPTIPLIANLGAVQLNYNFGVKECKIAIESIDADGLFLHLNPLQECIQKEGNTNFFNLLDQISILKNQLNVPLLIKEVGCGLSTEDIKQCVQRGICYIDIAGHGGTSWSSIEYYRDHSGQSLGKQFQDWGIPTPLALEQAIPYCKKTFIISSGGLRNGIDMVKSIILGARLCGFAGVLLKAALDSANSVILEIERIKHAFCIAMFLLGVKDVQSLHGNLQLILNKSFD